MKILLCSLRLRPHSSDVWLCEPVWVGAFATLVLFVCTHRSEAECQTRNVCLCPYLLPWCITTPPTSGLACTRQPSQHKDAKPRPFVVSDSCLNAAEGTGLSRVLTNTNKLLTSLTQLTRPHSLPTLRQHRSFSMVAASRPHTSDRSRKEDVGPQQAQFLHGDSST